MKTAVEWMEDQLKQVLPINQMNDIVIQDLFKKAKEKEKSMKKAQKIAKDHFRKQRDEVLLEQSKMYSEKDIINALHSVEVKYNRDFTKIYEGILEYLKEFKNK